VTDEERETVEMLDYLASTCTFFLRSRTPST
jgi:hypothetical protein